MIIYETDLELSQWLKTPKSSQATTCINSEQKSIKILSIILWDPKIHYATDITMNQFNTILSSLLQSQIDFYQGLCVQNFKCITYFTQDFYVTSASHKKHTSYRCLMKTSNNFIRGKQNSKMFSSHGIRLHNVFRFIYLLFIKPHTDFLNLIWA
jgi:hypothetical protein